MTKQERIKQFYRTHKRMPSYAEVAKMFGYKSKNAAYYVVKQLIKAGVLTKDGKGKIVPKVLVDGLPVLGVVEAGFPTAAEEELLDTMSIDEYLVKNKEATFMLHVKGDSMIDAGIMEGDIVLVERGKTPKHGQIVIAEVDGAYTMKYYCSAKGKVWLEPANKKYKPIYPENNLKVEAIVSAVIRKY